MTLPQGTISMAAPSWHAGCRPAYGTPRSDPGKRSILDQFDAGDAACWCFRPIARIDHVVLDKTGTLTLGRPELIGTREVAILAAATVGPGVARLDGRATHLRR
jgi:hypothetical protein